MAVNVNITNHKKIFVGLNGKTYDSFAKLKTKDSRIDNAGLVEPQTGNEAGKEEVKTN